MRSCCLSLLLAFWATLSTFAGSRPNVILFVTDDQSPIAGCYGSTDIQTPHLDALAAAGTRFTHAFATTASAAGTASTGHGSGTGWRDTAKLWADHFGMPTRSLRYTVKALS